MKNLFLTIGVCFAVSAVPVMAKMAQPQTNAQQQLVVGEGKVMGGSVRMTKDAVAVYVDVNVLRKNGMSDSISLMARLDQNGNIIPTSFEQVVSAQLPNEVEVGRIDAKQSYIRADPQDKKGQKEELYVIVYPLEISLANGEPFMVNGGRQFFIDVTNLDYNLYNK